MDPAQVSNQVYFIRDLAISFGAKLIGAIVLWFIGKWLINLAINLLKTSLAKGNVDPTIVRYIISFILIALQVVLIVAILGFFSVETTSFAALLAATGIAIGAAWGGLLANFAAGAFLVMFRPFKVGDFVSAAIPGGADFEMEVDSLMTFVRLWEHEVGTDQVYNTNVLAIESSFETSDLGWVAGGPSQPSPVGENRWLRVERVEPDFIQSGELELYVTGRPYAQEQDETSSAYVFDANTGKIDMKEQRRELRLKFVSNTEGGNYQLGKVIVTADLGDVRGYST